MGKSKSNIERDKISLLGLKVDVTKGGDGDIVTNGMANGTAKLTSKKAGATTLTGAIDEKSVVSGTDVVFKVAIDNNNDGTFDEYKDYKNVGEGTPSIGATLNLPITWGTVGSAISIVAPKGTSMIVAADETVYVKVADAFGNVKKDEEVKITVTYSDGTNTAKEESTGKTDANGLVAVTLKANAGFAPKTATITAIVGNESAQQTIQYKAAPTEAVAAFTVKKATYSYKSGSNPTVTLTFSNPVNADTVRKDLFTITTEANDKTYNIPISKVAMSSDNKKVVITLADQYKDGGLTDLTDYDIKIAAKAVKGITYNLCDTYGQTYSGAVVTFDTGMVN